MPLKRDATGTAAAAAGPSSRWAAHPIRAAILRTIVFVLPIAVSLGFVYIASHVLPAPTGSLVLYVGWWIALSGSATVLLIGVERVLRRFLPLIALYRVSLVFPDAAPSRFRAALGENTTATLEERLAQVRATGDGSTPVGAATHLLELVASLDQHDPLTRGHSERVRAYSQMIGKELRLRNDELDLLNWAALLHDVGKLEVPTEILSSTGTPTDEEWKVLRDHPARGADIVRSLEGWLGEWSRAVGEHHERWDGKGYPHQLRGEEIALAARIVAVADVFDVITSARSYKNASDTLTARQEITNCAGTQFDPVVVRAFLGISLGKLRLVMGPLSWLSHVPALARMPLTPVVGSAVGAAASIAAAVSVGLVHPTPAPAKPVAEDPTSPVVTSTRGTREDSPLVIRVAGAGAGAPILLRVVRAPSNGSTAVTSTGELIYTPPPNFNGTVVLGYHACWTGGTCEDGRVTVVVNPVNDAPVARPDRAETTAGRAVSIDVLANDQDPDGDTLSILRVKDASSGTAHALGGKVVFTPSPGFAGTARFTYSIRDGMGGTAHARDTVVVAGRDAPPPIVQPAPAVHEPVPAVHEPAPAPPKATTPAPASTPEPPKSEPEPEPTPAPTPKKPAPTPQKPAPTPQKPAPTPVPTPAPAPINPPSFAGGADQSVVDTAGPQVVSWASAIQAGSAHDLSFEVSVDQPGLFTAGGSPKIASDGTLTFEPAPNASGTAQVTVRLHGLGPGGQDLSSAARMFAITITHVNRPPVAAADSVSEVDDDEAGVTFNVLSNDFDPDGDSLTLSSVDKTGIAFGTLIDNGGGSFTFVPEAAHTGVTSFMYVVSDGHGGAATATATITVTHVNRPPIAGSDAYSVFMDTELVIAAPGLLDNDGDPDGVAVTLDPTPVVAPSHGQAVLLADGSFKYMPNPGYTGSDAFTYRISDSSAASAVGTVTLTVRNPPLTTGTLYFQTGDPLSNIWSLDNALPNPASPTADFDNDNHPGVTIKHGRGTATETDPKKFHIWKFTTPAPLVLDGPVQVDIWSTAGGFNNHEDLEFFAYLYDCEVGGTNCTLLTSNTILEKPWNTSTLSWGSRLLTIGSVSRTIPAGHELTLQLLCDKHDLWVMMTQQFPSALVLTQG